MKKNEALMSSVIRCFIVLLGKDFLCLFGH